MTDVVSINIIFPAQDSELILYLFLYAGKHFNIIKVLSDIPFGFMTGPQCYRLETLKSYLLLLRIAHDIRVYP